MKGRWVGGGGERNRDASLSFYSRFYKAYNSIYPHPGYFFWRVCVCGGGGGGGGGGGKGLKRVLHFFFFFFQKIIPPSPSLSLLNERQTDK